MLRYCYACNTTHPKQARCPQAKAWAGPKVATIRRRIYNRDEGVCQECGRDIEFNEFEVDHITPRAMGGTHTLTNLRLTCRDCNQAKGNG